MCVVHLWSRLNSWQRRDLYCILMIRATVLEMGDLDFGTSLHLFGFHFLFLGTCYRHWTSVRYCFLRPYFCIKTLRLLVFMPKLVSSVRMEMSGLVGWIPVEFKLYLFLQFLWVAVKLMCLSVKLLLDINHCVMVVGICNMSTERTKVISRIWAC